MKDRKNLSFVVSDASIIKERNNSQFATLKINAFASGLNRNNIYVGEEALQRTAWTIIGKPLLWAYNEEFDDAGSHETYEVPCGFVPEQNNLIFTRTDDGRSMLQVSAKIWNYYSGALIDFFKRDDMTKPVSVELEVIDYQDKEGTLELLDFAYTGVTILGSRVLPAIPGAKALVVNFSEATEKYNEALEHEFKNAKGKYKSERGDIIVNITDKTKDIVENDVEELILEDTAEGIEDIQEAEQPEEHSDGEEHIDNGAEEQEENAQKEATEETEDMQASEKSILQLLRDYFNDIEFITDFEALEQDAQMKKLFEIIKERDTSIRDFENKIQEFDSKLEELKSFKFNADEAEFKKQVEETISSVTHALSEDEISILLETSKDYSLENIDMWKNVAMANAYKATLNNKPQTPDISAPLHQKEAKKNTGSMLW